MVLHEARPHLRLEGVDEEFGVAVKKAEGHVPAVLVHGAEHQQAKVLGHGVASPTP